MCCWRHARDALLMPIVPAHASIQRPHLPLRRQRVPEQGARSDRAPKGVFGGQRLPSPLGAGDHTHDQRLVAHQLVHHLEWCRVDVEHRLDASFRHAHLSALDHVGACAADGGDGRVPHRKRDKGGRVEPVDGGGDAGALVGPAPVQRAAVVGGEPIQSGVREIDRNNTRDVDAEVGCRAYAIV